jgi:hypothetical protein
MVESPRYRRKRLPQICFSAQLVLLCVFGAKFFIGVEIPAGVDWPPVVVGASVVNVAGKEDVP